MASALNLVQKFFPSVRAVRDAKKNIEIEVTPADIKRTGVRKHDSCAMARACQRKMHLDGAVVSRSIAYLIKGNTAMRYVVPTAVAREITSFDRGAEFAPGIYSLYRPYAKNQLGQTGGRHGRDDNSRPRKKARTVANIRTVLGAVGR